MIRIYYQVYCDYCSRTIDNWLHRPTLQEIAGVGAVVRGRKVYCNEDCEANANHDATLARVGNLKQYRKPTKRI